MHTSLELDSRLDDLEPLVSKATSTQASATLPRSSLARALALTGLAVLLLVQTLSLVSRPTVKEAPPGSEPMAAEEEPQQIHRSGARLCTSGHRCSAPLCTPCTPLRRSARLCASLHRLHHCSPPPLCTAPALLTALPLPLTALLTEWGANVTAENAWREYPRPQLVRGDGVSSWRCLNGLWEYAISAASAPPPSAFEGSILVSLLDDLTLTLALALAPSQPEPQP